MERGIPARGNRDGRLMQYRQQSPGKHDGSTGGGKSLSRFERGLLSNREGTSTSNSIVTFLVEVRWDCNFITYDWYTYNLQIWME